MEVTNAAPNRWCVSPGSKKSFKTLAPEGVYNSRVKSAYDSVIKRYAMPHKSKTKSSRL